MGRWMQRIGEPQKIENTPEMEPSKPSKGGFEGFEGSPAAPSKKITIGFEGFEGAPTGVAGKTPPPDQEEIEERAALIEDGGIPRAWAEGLALLTTMPAPEDWGQDWQTVRDGILRFADALAGRWLAKASALGWTDVDLFGVDPDGPAARLDVRGAATFVADAEIHLITADAIIVGTRAGKRLRITRPTSKGGVPLWNLPA